MKKLKIKNNFSKKYKGHGHFFNGIV